MSASHPVLRGTTMSLAMPSLDHAKLRVLQISYATSNMQGTTYHLICRQSINQSRSSAKCTFSASSHKNQLL